MDNKQRNHMRFFRMLAATAIFLFALAGCMGRDRFTDEQEKLIVTKGKLHLESFFSVISPGVEKLEIGEYHMVDAAIEGALIYAGRYPANAVSVTFTADGKDYRAVADLDNNVTYSDYYMFDLDAQLTRQLKPYCERYSYTGDYEVKGAGTLVTLHYTNMKVDNKDDQLCNTYVILENMIPTKFYQEDETERADAYLKDAPVTDFTIWYPMSEEPLDPRILADYLAESGNCRVESTRSYVPGEYRICSQRAVEPTDDAGIYGFECVLTYQGEGKPMEYRLRREDYTKTAEGYTKAYTYEKYGTTESYATDEWVAVEAHE